MDVVKEYTMQEVLALISKKENVEKEISSMKGILDAHWSGVLTQMVRTYKKTQSNVFYGKGKSLTEPQHFTCFTDNYVIFQNSIGMSDPLVDSQGFPRNDIDVYQVRHARHRIICLQNDHKDLMKKIEAGLHSVHAQNTDVNDIPTASNTRKRPEEPIARITLVRPGSPAHLAGLEKEDLIISFGTVDESNFTTIKDIAAVVEHSAGRKISVCVLRSGKQISLSLTPNTSAGKGSLGCVIVPMEGVDR